jgi:SAM-dependent methyltransferase
MHTELADWWQSKTGAYLLKQERAALNEVLPVIFGYYLLQAGSWGPPGALLEASSIRTRLIMDSCGGAGAALAADPLYLPFAGDSLDAVILPHTLEQVAEPGRALREAERVLRGEGQLLILGFHPWGPWGLRRHLGARPPWNGRFLRLGRLQEWLTVLGFEITGVRQILFRPPWQQRLLLVRSAFLDRLAWRVTAGAYLIVARKRVFSMTPLRLRRAVPQRSFSGVAKPTTRGMS